MTTTNLLRSVLLSSALTIGLAAQGTSQSPAAVTSSGTPITNPSNPDSNKNSNTDPNAPYRGQTGLPNDAAKNDEPNTALSGNTPQTNSSLQQTRSGNLGWNFGWLGLLGLGGLFGLSRGTNEHPDPTHEHDHTPEVSRS